MSYLQLTRKGRKCDVFKLHIQHSAKEFKYLGVLFMSDVKMELQRWFGAAFVVRRCGENRDEPQGLDLCSMVRLHSAPHPWSRVLGSDKDMVVNTSR